MTQDQRFLRMCKIEPCEIPAIDPISVAGEMWLEGKLTLNQATERAIDASAERLARDPHAGCLARWLEERDAKDESTCQAAAMRLAAETWCERAREEHQAMVRWRFAVITLTAVLAGMLWGWRP